MTDAAVDAVADDVPEEIGALCGQVQYEELSEIPVEHGYIWTSCASVENGNPIFWDEKIAADITGGPIAPPSMVSVWFRPHNWAPGRTEQALPLQVHFDLKEKLGLPEAVMTDNTIVFYEPVRIGDLLSTHQVLRSVSALKTTKLGEGRFWVIDVIYTNQRQELVAVESYTGFGYRRVKVETGAVAASGSSSGSSAPPAPDDERDAAGEPSTSRSSPWSRTLDVVSVGERLAPLSYDVSATTVVLGALATRDWRPMHHDKDFAVERNGTRDIFLNTPNQAAWFERFITDWTGPRGRLGRIRFRMKGSVFPGDTMVMTGEVTATSTDETGCGWVDLALALGVGGEVATSATARVAIPVAPDDNPWRRSADRWKP
ncbi:MAG: MaoC family dehydratase N-terminal domain-containing protein [Acidimicrobiales bacterium]